jgi:hypothetical protein
MGSVQPDQVNKISYTAKSPKVGNLEGVQISKETAFGKCISKKTGRGNIRFPSPFKTKPRLRTLVLIKQLPRQGRLVGVGVAGTSLINGAIGPVLPKLRSP